MASIATAARRVDQGREPEATVWATVAAALIIGFIIMNLVQNRTESGGIPSSTISYPANWVKTSEPGADFAAADLDRGGPYGSRIALRAIDKQNLAPSQNITDTKELTLNAATSWSLKRGVDVTGYRTLSLKKTTVGGKPAVNVESGYLMEQALGGGTTNVMPGLMHAVDTVVLGSDNKFYILTFAAEQSIFGSKKDLHSQLLSSWKVP